MSLPLRPVLIAALLVSALAGCAGTADAPGHRAAPGSTATGSTPSGEASRSKSGPVLPAGLSSAVNRQLTYALTYWKTYNTAEFETLGEDDCVNFTSQTLLQRGWTQDDEWYYDASSVYDSGAAWRSSTALRDYLEEHPERATALDDTQRDQVVPGDIVQFDWDGSGDRDHTGVVTRVEKTGAGIKIAFAGHTEDSDFRDVDEAITVDHPGGTAYYWHLAD
ncbi:amidase domain-containing protein [Naasia aerilata]|uniref:Putative amidase domain-containing protein n=1 Tax=Naasia aerilata TaxID=1162966 RepID=A0ABM8GB67_9MICO|nr:amidase domain-containing protein [Naasia aerilata]BDZ45464.1 hypothetical protein GCM10025866_13730 [Naasia aerilata]